MARNWKRVYPNNIVDALRLCKDYALARRRLSVERIAELMGSVTADTLYKWLATGRMPVSLIPSYEHVCGIALVSQYLATSGGRMVIDMPTGHAANPESIQTLQEAVHGAVGALLAYYRGQGDATATLTAVMAGMEQLAYHHSNVQQADAPQLDFGDSR